MCCDSDGWLQEVRYVSRWARVWTAVSVIRCSTTTTVTVHWTPRVATAREVRATDRTLVVTQYLNTWASAQGQMGSAEPPGKMDEKLKSENMQKRAVLYVYVIYWEQSGQADVENGAICRPHIYSDALQNAPFRSQIFKIFFASGGKGALTPNQNPADVAV